MIYFIKSDSGHVKIGYTASQALSRFSSIRNSCPFNVEVVKIIEGNRQQEVLLHRKFSKYRTVGEWFVFSEKIRLFIENPHTLEDPVYDILYKTEEDVIDDSEENYTPSGLKAKPPRKSTSISLREDLLDFLRGLKEEHQLSVSAILDQVLDDYFKEELKKQ